MSKVVCIISGGMDSALSAKIAQNEGDEIIALHFNYGQRTEAKELACYRKIAASVNAIESYEIDLPFFEQIGASALTDKNIDIPTGGIEEGVPVTYVPFRNGIFISIATALAEKHEASALFIGVVEEDSSGYPDCRDSYIKSMEESINLGTKDETKPTYDMVEPDDLVHYGLIPELVGRLPIIASLNEITEDDMVRILTEPKNSLIKQYKKLFFIDDVTLNFEEDSLRAIAQKAIKRKTGARGLRAILEESMIDIMYELPEYAEYEVLITKDVIEKNAKPIYIKKSSQKTA